ncbi:MAG: hypothetical protein ACI8X5_001673 [Planctomycetota bacterium]|jgi:hypothetical protein
MPGPDLPCWIRIPQGNRFLFRQQAGTKSAPKGDKDKVWWNESGVNQNMTFPPQPDPMSGMHCWHQKVRVEAPKSGDHYGDVEVDTDKSWEVYLEWKKKTVPAPGPGGLRRPLWMNRPLKPTPETYQM